MAEGTSERLLVFDGGSAVITGGASGIGLAMAQALASRGCEIVRPIARSTWLSRPPW